MSSSLFHEFDKISAKQWKQKIQFDLAGADYNQSLVWNSPDGVNVKPFYHPDDSPQPISVRPACGWNITERIYVSSPEKAKIAALEALAKGAESLWFILPSEEISIELLFSELPLEKVRVYLECQFLSKDFFSKLNKLSSPRKQQVFLQTDIIGKLARTGNWFHNMNQDHQLLEEILAGADNFPSVIGINASLYQNAGATIPQQLAYALAHANEYLNIIDERFPEKETVKNTSLSFQLAVGSNYFFEIAKIRALRYLYTSLANEYGFRADCHILALPSKRNKTIYDYNVNLLRTTTECMSAILGGADAVCNLPYDALYHKDNDFSRRIARNQLLILKNESYFEKVANPAEGSYYVESLTQEFAEKALDIFKEIEKSGGFLKLLKEGIIQKKIVESAKKEQEAVENNEKVLVGINKFINPSDTMNSDLELYPFLKINRRKTLVQPILEKRLAGKLEQQRIKEEEESLSSKTSD